MGSLYLSAASAVVVSVCAGLIAWSTGAVFLGGRDDVYAENGILENVQAGLLAAACVGYLGLSAAGKRSGRLVTAFFALLCYAFVLRELNVEEFDLPDIMVWLGHGVGRNLSLAVALLAVLFCAARDLPSNLKAALVFARSLAGRLMVAAGVLLLVGDFFEKFDGIPHHVLFEEVAELCGCALILLSSFFAPAVSRAQLFVQRIEARRAGAGRTV